MIYATGEINGEKRLGSRIYADLNLDVYVSI